MPDTALVESHDLFTVAAPPLASTQLPTDAYVLFTAVLPEFYAASTSPPSNVIHLLDKSSLRSIYTLPGHSTATTALRSAPFILLSSRDTLISTGKDGTVKIWDNRSPTHRAAAITMTPAGRPRALLCCDVAPDGLTVAAGTELYADDALILYWDPRHPAAPLRTHSSTHSDDITAVHYLPKAQPTLLSASSDGLIATSDPTQDDEDESVLYVSNWGCSVAQAGWILPPSKPPRIWAASDMETFSTWSHELDPHLSADIRGPSVHTQQRTWVSDYFISCPSPTPDLNLFLGSNEGDIALISIPPDTPAPPAWTLHRLWTNGHVGVVRSVLYDQQAGVLITGGEDSKINAWPCPPLPTHSPVAANSGSLDDDASSDDDDMDVDSVGSFGSRKRSRHTTKQSSKRTRTTSD